MAQSSTATTSDLLTSATASNDNLHKLFANKRVPIDMITKILQTFCVEVQYGSDGYTDTVYSLKCTKCGKGIETKYKDNLEGKIPVFSQPESSSQYYSHSMTDHINIYAFIVEAACHFVMTHSDSKDDEISVVKKLNDKILQQVQTECHGMDIAVNTWTDICDYLDPNEEIDQSDSCKAKAEEETESSDSDDANSSSSEDDDNNDKLHITVPNLKSAVEKFWSITHEEAITEKFIENVVQIINDGIALAMVLRKNKNVVNDQNLPVLNDLMKHFSGNELKSSDEFAKVLKIADKLDSVLTQFDEYKVVHTKIVQNLQEENAKAVQSLTEKINNLELELAFAQQESGVYKKSDQEKSSRIFEMELEIEDLKKTHTEKEKHWETDIMNNFSELSSKNLKITELEENIKYVTNERNSFLDTAEMFRRHWHECQQDLREAKIECAEYSDKFREQFKLNNVLKLENDNYGLMNIPKMKADLAQTKADLAQEQSQNNDLQSEIQELKSEIGELKKTHDEKEKHWETDIMNNFSELSSKNQTIANLESEIRGITDDRNAYLKDANIYRQRWNNAEQDLRNAKIECTTYSDKLREQTELNTVLKVGNDSYSSMNNNLGKELRELHADFAQVKIDLAQEQIANNDLRSEIQELKSEIATEKAEVLHTRSVVAEKVQYLAQAHLKCDELQFEKRTLTDQVKQLQFENQALSDQVQRLQLDFATERTKLTQTTESARIKYNDLIKEVYQTKSELEQTQIKCNNLTYVASQLRSELEAKQLIIDSATQAPKIRQCCGCDNTADHININIPCGHYFNTCVGCHETLSAKCKDCEKVPEMVMQLAEWPM